MGTPRLGVCPPAFGRPVFPTTLRSRLLPPDCPASISPRAPGIRSPLPGYQIFERNAIKHAFDGTAQLPPHTTGHASIGSLTHTLVRHAIHKRERALHCAQDLTQPDLCGLLPQHEPPACTPNAGDQASRLQRREQGVKVLPGYVLPLGQGAHQHRGLPPAACQFEHRPQPIPASSGNFHPPSFPKSIEIVDYLVGVDKSRQSPGAHTRIRRSHMRNARAGRQEEGHRG